ncbi:Uncharacterised protein [Mycobacteroides abscessus]|nr:Uncharacterised protein [Mycobacteroides abscessus]
MRSSTTDCACSQSSSAAEKRNDDSASRTRPVPARTPYRRPGGRRRVKTSKRQCRPAVPSASAAWSIVSS